MIVKTIHNSLLVARHLYLKIRQDLDSIEEEGC